VRAVIFYLALTAPLAAAPPEHEKEEVLNESQIRRMGENLVKALEEAKEKREASDPDLESTMSGRRGIVEDLRVAQRWRPILPLLEKFESSRGVLAKAEALQAILLFAHRQSSGGGSEPQGLLILRKTIDLMRTDPEWRRIIEDLLGGE